MEWEAADHQFVLFLCLHWDGTIVVQIKNLPVESNSVKWVHMYILPQV